MHHLATIFKLYNLSDEHAQESFAQNAARFMYKVEHAIVGQEPVKFLAEFPKILDRIWRETHIRSQLFELLSRHIYNGTSEENATQVELIQKIAMAMRKVYGGSFDKIGMIRRLREVYESYPDARDHMSIIWSATPFKADPHDRFAWQDYAVREKLPLAIYMPSDHASVCTDIKLTANAAPAEQDTPTKPQAALLSGQRAAFEELTLMLQARRECLNAGGITPRLHALIIGPSGSGKTHVVRAFAQAESLALYEQSAASWMPNGSKANISTPQKIAQFVDANNKGVLYIDEIEKPFPKDLLAGSTWERANADELMSLLDAKTSFWEGWSAELARKLDEHFFVVLSGAWQAAYQQAFRVHSLLGGDWSNLSIADSFLESNHLPAELLNRVSTNIIEILPPTRDELKEMILSVQRDLGLEENETEAFATAKEIVEERKGIRGVESYMLKCWMAIQRETPVPMDSLISDLRTNEIQTFLSGDSAGSVA